MTRRTVALPAPRGALLGALLCALAALPACSSPSHDPFFTVQVTWSYQDAMGGASSCTALKVSRVVATLGTSSTNMEFAPPASDLSACMRDGGAGIPPSLELSGYSNQMQDLYLQAFDSSGNLVAFGKKQPAVQAGVADNAMLQVMVVLKPPAIPGCGDGLLGGDAGAGKQCDDYLDNNCNNCKNI